MAAYGQHCLLYDSKTPVPTQTNITNAAAMKTPAAYRYAKIKIQIHLCSAAYLAFDTEI